MNKHHLSRREFVYGAAALLASAGVARAEHPFYGGVDFTRDPALIPPAESPVDFPIPLFESKLDPRLRHQVVTIGSNNPEGRIIVDPQNHFLYYLLGGDQAIRYGVGVGREGFAWSGNALVGMKRKWPRWLPPEGMVERDPNARKWANGMPGGPDNPLGARAMYLFANGIDTLYRIHGTNEPTSIGKSMSSGCIRMLDENVADLYDKVSVGTPVTVLPSNQPTAEN